MFGYLKFFIFLFILFAMPLDGFAEDDDVKSLGEILNQGPVQDDDGVELTPKLLANRYYKECTKEKSLIFDEEEQNLLCTCVSANMARTLSVEEFQLLDEDSAQGTWKETQGFSSAVRNDATPAGKGKWRRDLHRK